MTRKLLGRIVLGISLLITLIFIGTGPVVADGTSSPAPGPVVVVESTSTSQPGDATPIVVKKGANGEAIAKLGSTYIKIRPEEMDAPDIMGFYTTEEGVQHAYRLHLIQNDAEWTALKEAGAKLVRLRNLESARNMECQHPILVSVSDHETPRFWVKKGEKTEENRYLLPEGLPEPRKFRAAIEESSMPATKTSGITASAVRYIEISPEDSVTTDGVGFNEATKPGMLFSIRKVSMAQWQQMKAAGAELASSKDVLGDQKDVGFEPILLSKDGKARFWVTEKTDRHSHHWLSENEPQPTLFLVVYYENSKKPAPSLSRLK